VSGRTVEVPASAVRTRLASAGFRSLFIDRGDEVYERRHGRDPRYAVRTLVSVHDHAVCTIVVSAIYYSGAVLPGGEWACPDVAYVLFESGVWVRPWTVEAVLDRSIDRASEAYAVCNRHRRGGSPQKGIGDR